MSRSVFRRAIWDAAFPGFALICMYFTAASIVATAIDRVSGIAP